MQRNFRISVDGRSYTVAVEEISDVGAPSAAVAFAPVPVPVPAAASSPAPAAAGHDVLAPLAGTVFSIDVRIGQVVSVGEQVAVIDAMKMETPVVAKFAGTVQRIAVKAHDNVDTGQVILTVG